MARDNNVKKNFHWEDKWIPLSCTECTRVHAFQFLFKIILWFGTYDGVQSNWQVALAFLIKFLATNYSITEIKNIFFYVESILSIILGLLVYLHSTYHILLSPVDKVIIVSYRVVSILRDMYIYKIEREKFGEYKFPRKRFLLYSFFVVQLLATNVAISLICAIVFAVYATSLTILQILLGRRHEKFFVWSFLRVSIRWNRVN